MKKKNMKRMKSQRGQAIVEFAIVVPMLLMLLLGTMEWGFLLWTQTSYVNAVRDGARNAVVIQDWGDDTATKIGEVRGIVENRLQALPPSITTGIDANITVELLPSATNIESIRVSIASQPYDPIIGFAGFLVPDTLSATSEFRYEGSM